MFTVAELQQALENAEVEGFEHTASVLREWLERLDPDASTPNASPEPPSQGPVP